MKLRSIILAAIVIGLSACATQPITYTYAPTSKLNVDGEMKVGDFRYIPGESEKIKPNQIRNTALGSVVFQKNIDEYIEDAVFLESRVVGIDINDAANVLYGEINEFLVDDLGFSVDWTLDIRYVIDNCYDKNHKTFKTTEKFGDVFGHLSTVIKLNVDMLLSDNVFQACINNGFINDPTRSVTNLTTPVESELTIPSVVKATPNVVSSYPDLVEELNSSSVRIMQQAAKRIGEQRLYNDEGLILALISVLERSIDEGINSNDKYQLDGLAWCALNLGNAGDRRALPVLRDLAASGSHKKVISHAKHAIKQFGVAE